MSRIGEVVCIFMRGKAAIKASTRFGPSPLIGPPMAQGNRCGRDAAQIRDRKESRVVALAYNPAAGAQAEIPLGLIENHDDLMGDLMSALQLIGKFK